jgi:general stress protein YciG
MAQQHIGNPGNFAEDRRKAAEAGQNGGQNSGGNFANDPARAAEAGHKGGQHSGGNLRMIANELLRPAARAVSTKGLLRWSD